MPIRLHLAGVLTLFSLLTWVHSGRAADQNFYSTPPGYTRTEYLATNLIRVPKAPSPAQMTDWLDSRKKAQVRTVQKFQAFHDFQFADRIEESQITFRHQPVDDASKTFKLAHYDHGTGMAVADVDGDGLPDIYFVNQHGRSELWRNLGHGKFEDITDRAGVGLKDKVCVGASFADIDNDGRPDLFVTTVRMGNVLFHNLGGGRFENISRSAGVDAVAHSSGAVFFDFNHDGLLDLFVCNVGVYTSEEKGPDGAYHAYRNAFFGHMIPERTEHSILYQNLGGLKFKNVSREVDLDHAAWSGDASFCDLDGNGYPGLYVLSMAGSDSYYHNFKGARFENQTATRFGRTPWGSMGIKFFDYDQDGLMDLYVTDMHSDMSDLQSSVGSTNMNRVFERQKSEAWCAIEWATNFLPLARSNYIFGNAFYQNQGQGLFSEVSDQIGAETYWPWGVSVGDLNADGYEDVFITAGMGYPSRYGINSLLLNEHGQEFFEAEFVTGIEPRSESKREIDYFTLDFSEADKDHEWSRHHSGKLTVRAATSSRSSAIFDVDDDGDLDLVVNSMNDRPQVFISNLTERKQVHFLKIKLKGTVSNADALGATVKVRTGGKTYTQFNDGKSGYLSQSSMPLYFGLGEATKVEEVEVLWPSGKKEVLNKDLPINTLLRVTEGQAR